MHTLRQLFRWTVLSPVLAWVLYGLDLSGFHALFEVLKGLLLILSVLAAVHHAEVVAHKVGEPFGAVILAIAITIIEVALIISLMIVGGEKTITLARDTVFAAIMLILNGILGACLLLGGAWYREQFFEKESATTALISLVAILVLTLILPNYTTSATGPVYTEPQLIFVAIACIAIYVAFLLVQTVRHRDYFLPNTTDEEDHATPPTSREAALSLVMLLVCLSIVVLLAKSLSPVIEAVIEDAGLPEALVGVVIASVILLPESIAAINAARKNRLQTSLNLALGSALASIGLTIPAVAILCASYDINLVLGLDPKSTVLLVLSVFIVMLSLSRGKTNILYGVVLLVNLAAYIFTIIFP